jgi:anti-anti-sigma regulatory factor
MSESTMIILPAQMTIDTADSLAAEWNALPVSAKPCVTMDGSKVENITTPAVQLILAFDKTITESNGTLAITGKTECFTQVFYDLGLKSFLDRLCAAQ